MASKFAPNHAGAIVERKSQLFPGQLIRLQVTASGSFLGVDQLLLTWFSTPQIGCWAQVWTFLARPTQAQEWGGGLRGRVRPKVVSGEERGWN